MEWIEENDGDYIFGLPGNATLDALTAKAADNLRFHHAQSSEPKVRTWTSFTYQAGSWTRPRRVVAQLECSLQPDTGRSFRRTACRVTAQRPIRCGSCFTRPRTG
jgi:hypothetical protein